MSREKDKQLIEKIPKEDIADFIFLHLRDLWAVDGLYFLGIEEQFGTEAAIEIDRKCWEVMGKIEARKLKKFLNLETATDIPSMLKVLSHSCWALDLEDKEIIIKKNRGIIRNTKCRVQNTRLQNNLEEFPCKRVRWGFLKSFAHEFNPDIVVNCMVCPPDKHTDDLWCEWEFIIKK